MPLTKYMAKELGARRIAVNIVAPGAILLWQRLCLRQDTPTKRISAAVQCGTIQRSIDTWLRPLHWVVLVCLMTLGGRWRSVGSAESPHYYLKTTNGSIPKELTFLVVDLSSSNRSK
jgi:hypothetical protein